MRYTPLTHVEQYVMLAFGLFYGWGSLRRFTTPVLEVTRCSITHRESGRSGVGRTRNVVSPASLAGLFEQPNGPTGPPILFAIPCWAT
jgi:hypothetical protein